MSLRTSQQPKVGRPASRDSGAPLNHAGCGWSFRPGRAPVARAFTLIELLVVISIIGVLAAISLPAIRGMNKSNAMIASNQQFQDDLAYARQRAIADHTSVYVVFVPPEITSYVPATTDQPLLHQYTNLLGGQYTTYALLSLRQLGEQPGRATPRYLTSWRNLPAGVFIAAAKFGAVPPPLPPLPPGVTNLFQTSTIFPFPNATNFPGLRLPYVGFDYLGRLTAADGTTRTVDEYIPLARGSIFYARGPDGAFVGGSPADVQESAPGNSFNLPNVIRINALTGRAQLQRQEIQ